MAPVPHAKVLLGDIATTMLSDEPNILVPKQVLAQLLELYLSCWDFDEDWYLSKYPDVKNAVKSGVVESGRNHFKQVGYFEGRAGAAVAVDADWYLETYPDVAKAVIDGRVTTVHDHYTNYGHAEGRFPRDPKIDLNWYRSRYFSSTSAQKPNSHKDVLEHFVRISYLKFAVPAMPR